MHTFQHVGAAVHGAQEHGLQAPVADTACLECALPAGGLVALWMTGTPFSVSSGIGFLALFGVSVQTAVV
ncbi:MAG TPA: hypothetical protein VMT50_02585, partial [Steroidobacteraceae bacterium]|nr:hypothetical protein [Steroidobacteraceae bacterium]